MLLLRPYTASDLVFARERLYGPHAGPLQWFGWSPPRAEQEFAVNGLLGLEGGRMVVELDGEPVGGVQWFRKSWGPPETSWCWEIGISVVQERRGQGIGTDAQRLLLAYLLDHTPAERVQAVTDVENLAEQRALDKAGFTREGRVRRAQWRSGAWHDQYLYAFVRADLAG